MDMKPNDGCSVARNAFENVMQSYIEEDEDEEEEEDDEEIM
jgi:hypothetical protein